MQENSFYSETVDEKNAEVKIQIQNYGFSSAASIMNFSLKSPCVICWLKSSEEDVI